MTQRFLRFLPFLYCVLFAASLLGCAAPMAEHHPSWSLLPTSAEVEADAARLAIPREFRAKLKAIVAESCKSAGKTRPDPQLVGQTVNPYDPVADMRNRMLIALLKWGVEQAYEKSPEERAATLQARQKLPLPPLEWQPSVPVPEAEAPPLIEHPIVQFSEGAVSGGLIGTVPFGPYGAEIGMELRLLPKGTYWARVGKACGEIVIGTGQIILGCAGMGAGAGMSGTGGGAAVGVPVMAGSFTIAANGCMTTGHGGGDLYQLLHDGDTATNGPSESPAPEGRFVLKKSAKKPATEAPVAEAVPPAKPAQPRAPTETTTRTLYKDSSGKTVKRVTKTGETTTTTVYKTPAAQTTKPVNNPANSGTTTVYRSVNPVTKEVQYVGLTDDLARRQLEHLRERGFRIRAVIGGLSRLDARAVEQALIEMHGLEKNGGTLLNKINSIAKTNPDLAQLLQHGYDLLKSANYAM